MRILALILTIFIFAVTAGADTPTVSVLTCAPGQEIYQLEGHTALRIKSEEYDMTVNWGVFDFAAPGFVYRFVKGETDYMSVMCPTDLFLTEYLLTERRVTEQVLDLDSVQTATIIQAIKEAVKPQNRVYRYNYILDNCATRPIAVIEKNIGDTLTFSPEGIPSQESWRDVMHRYHKNYPWYQFGIDLALGAPLDNKISVRQHIFAPETLERMLEKATTVDDKPIVKKTRIIAPGAEYGTPLPPTPWYLTPLFATIILLIITITVSAFDIKERRKSKWFDTVLYTLFGAAGCVILFLVTISVHEATSPNWLLLWLNPLCLALPVMIWIKRFRSGVYALQWMNLAGIISFATIWSAGIQIGNIAFIPLMLSDAIRAVTYIYLYRNE